MRLRVATTVVIALTAGILGTAAAARAHMQPRLRVPFPGPDARRQAG